VWNVAFADHRHPLVAQIVLGHTRNEGFLLGDHFQVVRALLLRNRKRLTDLLDLAQPLPTTLDGVRQWTWAVRLLKWHQNGTLACASIKVSLWRSLYLTSEFDIGLVGEWPGRLLREIGDFIHELTLLCLDGVCTRNLMLLLGLVIRGTLQQLSRD